MMARNTNVPFKGRIQKRKTHDLQIITFGLQRAAGPYRSAKRRHHFGHRGAVSSMIRSSIRCGHLFHERSKSNDDFGYSLTLVNGTTERPLDFFQIPRLSAQPDQPGLCTKDRRRDSVGDRVGFRIAAAHEFRAGPQWYLAPRVAHTFLRPEKVLIN
jgi:hypothetical protein